jgi:hypothetical protein
MELYIIYEVDDSTGFTLKPKLYASYEAAVAVIRKIVEDAGVNSDGDEIGAMETDSSKQNAGSEKGTMVGNLHDYTTTYWVQRVSTD